MKTLLANKLLLAIVGGVVIVGGGAGAYLITKSNSNDSNKTSSTSTSSNSGTTASKDDNFIKTGQNSFGLDVCNEITKEKVTEVTGVHFASTKDYSNQESTGCQYYTDAQLPSMVIVDVGFSDMTKQKSGLTALGYTTKPATGISLENFVSVNDSGQVVDVYMNIAPGQKFVRVGRGSTSVIDEPALLKLASAVEQKIRSYK